MVYIIPQRPACRRSFCTFLVLYVTMLGRLTSLRPCHGWVSKKASGQLRRGTPSIRQADFRLRQQHYFSVSTTAADRRSKCSLPMSSTSADAAISSKMINLHTIPVEELETILKSWGHPKYRAKQVYDWVHVQGVTNVDEMNNIPKKLRQHLKDHSAVGTLQLDTELISKDGTIKRAYRLADGQLIESVLMPYQDGRYTACISSQAGCAQGCVFCATGQMGFSRQLTPDEILEQVSRFASELAAKDKLERKEGESDQKKGGTSKNHGRSTRLSNIVFMGMGEPLANFRNVKTAIQRIHDELGIGHRKITVSTVGIVPNIAKMASELPQVRLAVSLHCASDEERTALLPANRRYGGLDELMSTLKEYIQTTGKRITLEWALIEGENDTPETAHKLGKLVQKWLRRDMVHVNVIPLNPTGGYGGGPSGRQRVNDFCQILEQQYKVACTPRVRRGIDINAGCGQLTSEIEQREKKEAAVAAVVVPTTIDEEQPEMKEREILTNSVRLDKGEEEEDDPTSVVMEMEKSTTNEKIILMEDGEDWEDHEYQTPEELSEVERLVSLVKGTTITSENAVVGGTQKKKATTTTTRKSSL